MSVLSVCWLKRAPRWDIGPAAIAQHPVANGTTTLNSGGAININSGTWNASGSTTIGGGGSVTIGNAAWNAVGGTIDITGTLSVNAGTTSRSSSPPMRPTLKIPRNSRSWTSIINSMDLTTAQKNVLLAAVPEPGTFAFGVIGVVQILRHRNRRPKR